MAAFIFNSGIFSGALVPDGFPAAGRSSKDPATAVKAEKKKRV